MQGIDHARACASAGPPRIIRGEPAGSADQAVGRGQRKIEPGVAAATVVNAEFLADAVQQARG